VSCANDKVHEARIRWSEEQQRKTNYKGSSERTAKQSHTKEEIDVITGCGIQKDITANITEDKAV